MKFDQKSFYWISASTALLLGLALAAAQRGLVGPGQASGASPGGRSHRTGSHHHPEQSASFIRSGEWAESMNQAGMTVSEPEASFAVIGESGDVDFAALEAAGVARGKLEQVGDAIDEARKSTMKDLKSRLESGVIGSTTGLENGDQYLIPSDSTKSDAVLGNLKTKLEKILGPETASNVMGGLHPVEQLGYFGRHDIRLRVHRSADSETPLVEYQCFDPETGVAVTGGIVTKEEEMKRLFGDALSELTR